MLTKRELYNCLYKYANYNKEIVLQFALSFPNTIPNYRGETMHILVHERNTRVLNDALLILSSLSSDVNA